MADLPTFAVPGGFLGTTRRAPAALTVLGVPFDAGTTNRAGTRDGPHAIRRASRMLVDGAHPIAWVEPASFDLGDIGDLPAIPGDIPATLALIEREATGLPHVIALGGEHGITLGLLRALARRTGPLALVQFDAHVDTWPDGFGQPLGHGSVIYNAIAEGLVDPHRLVQIGIRSPVQRTVWDWTLAQGITVLSATEVHEAGPAAIAARVRAVVGEAPAYLSFDIDALDPAFAPGTGTPEIGGLASWQAQAILRRLGGLAWAGMDVVEVAPAYDISEITALAGATMAWEYLALVGAMSPRDHGAP